MLATRLIGTVALGLLTALVFGYIFLYSLSKSLDWLDIDCGTGIKRLLKQPLQSSSNDSGRKRGDAEYRIYLHYLLQNGRRFVEWVDDAVHVHMCPKHKNTDNQCPNARPKGFVQLRHSIGILNTPRKPVNQSGKEPTQLLLSSGALFCVGTVEFLVRRKSWMGRTWADRA